MKLSENTLAILNNFKGLNDAFLFKPGNEIKNLSEDGSIFMTATIEESFPKEFAVYSLREFLQVVSVIKGAEIEFGDKSMTISNGATEVSFFYAKTKVVEDIYDQKLTLTDPAFDVKLSAEQIKNISKMSAYLGINDMKIVAGDPGKLVLYDGKGSHDHTYTIKTDAAIEAEPVSFNLSTLSLLDIPYNFSYFPNKKFVRFSGDGLKVNYHVKVSRKG